MVGHKGETSVVGCKVLPICDVMSAGSNSGESSDAGDQKIEGRKSEKRYGVMRMKELIRQAVAAKAHRVGARAWKVLNLQNREAAKDLDDNRSSNSSKISFMWDVRNCASTFSVYTNRADQISVMNLSNLHSNLSNLSSDLNNSVPDQASISKLSTQSVECVRMGQWITTDTDFVVLEL